MTLAYRWSTDRLATALGDFGCTEVARLVRRPEESERGFPQAQLLLRRG